MNTQGFVYPSASIPPATLQRQADGRLIAPLLCPTHLDAQLIPQHQLPQQQALIEEEMASLQLRQEIEDERVKQSRLEWCLREILAERDILLRQHEDEARQKRQQELQQLSQHLAAPTHARARPRSTSAPPAMTTIPPVPTVGPPPAQPLRPQPHSFRISLHHRRPLPQLQAKPPVQQQQMHDLAQLPFLSLSHSTPATTCEAARLLGLPPDVTTAAPTDTLVRLGSRPQRLQPHYHQLQPTKRARLNSSLPADTIHQHQPNLPARTFDVTPSQASVASVAANTFPHHHNSQTTCGALSSPSTSTSTTPTTTVAGCESPDGGLILAGTLSSQSFDTTGPFSSALSSSFGSEWTDCSAEPDWPQLSIDDEVDYDELLNNLSSGL